VQIGDLKLRKEKLIGADRASDRRSQQKAFCLRDGRFVNIAVYRAQSGQREFHQVQFTMQHRPGGLTRGASVAGLWKYFCQV